MYRSALWTMRQYSGQSTPDSTNERFKYLLKNGQTGLSLAFDLPTQIGLDSDNSAGRGRRGEAGGGGGFAGRFRADLRRDRAGPDLDVVHDQRDGADHPGDVRPGGEEAGGRAEEAAGDDPERHPEGVHRAGDLDLPAGAVDQAGGGPGGVLQPGDPAVQRDQRVGDAHHGVRGEHDAVGGPGDLDRGGVHRGGAQAGIARSTRSRRSFRSTCRSGGGTSTSSRTSADSAQRGGTGRN